jgi:transposase
MAKRFRPYSLDQDYLLPPSIKDWLPEGHLARFIGDVTQEMDLQPLLGWYRNGDGRGLAAYNPVMMLRLILYGYCVGKRSSRQLEKATYDEVPFRYLAGNQHPDHDTIATFRKEHLASLGNLFVGVLQLCCKAGMVKVGQVAIDGTKMRANADRNYSFRYNELSEQEQALQKQVEQMLVEAAQIDAEEDAQYGKGRKPEELPEELRSAETRLAKIREIRQRLQQEAEERAAAARKERAESGGKHRNNAARKRFERATQPVEKRNPLCNFTDGDSAIMPNPAGGFLQGYNAQAAVEGSAQVIVAAEMSNDAADVKQLVPMVKAAEQALRQARKGEARKGEARKGEARKGEADGVAAAAIGDEGAPANKPEAVLAEILADAGYFYVEALQDEVFQDKAVWVTPDSRKQMKEHKPTNMHAVAQQMRAKLSTEEGKKRYARRGAIIEPVFAWIKHVRGIRSFLLRGLEAVRNEWRIICLTQNLLKLQRYRAANVTS